MKKSDRLLKELISSHEPKSSKELAAVLDVSSKTIINYINDINLNDEIVHSSKEGYWVDKEKATLYINDKPDIPQDYDERVEYIIKQFLLFHNESINIYKLCDELFVSYSTIKNDIAKMNHQFNYLDIRFILRNNHLFIDGKEKNKRKLMSKVIYSQHKNLLSIQLLKDSFPDVDVSLIAETINTILKNNNYYLNDFSRMNIIIHYSIVIDRMMNGYIINPQDNLDLSNITSAEKKLVEDLNSELSKKFSLALSKEEIYELLILIRTNAQKTEIGNTDIYQQFIDKSIVDYVDRLVQKLKKRYYLDLKDDQFIVPFTLHLNNLKERLKYKNPLKNTISVQLKDTSPILYDIALYIAKDFCCELGYNDKLPAEEVGFIAIHVGSQIERDNVSIEKLNIVLVCPNYIHIAASIRNKILYNLGTKINIINTVGEYTEQDFKYCDAIISIVNIPNIYNIPSVLVSPFITDMDIAKIFDMISSVKNRKTLQILKDEFEMFFCKENFMIINNQISKEECIHIMSKRLKENGYVNNGYENKVIARENSCSTSFYNFAIPHSFEMDALTSGVFLLISNKGIIWNDSIVNIVMMIAMNQNDNMFFYQLYEAIINMLTDEVINSMIKNIDSFDQFRSIIQNI